MKTRVHRRRLCIAAATHSNLRRAAQRPPRPPRLTRSQLRIGRELGECKFSVAHTFAEVRYAAIGAGQEVINIQRLPAGPASGCCLCPHCVGHGGRNGLCPILQPDHRFRRGILRAYARGRRATFGVSPRISLAIALSISATWHSVLAMTARVSGALSPHLSFPVFSIRIR